MLWPPKEGRLQFLVFLVFPGLNQHKSFAPKTKGGREARQEIGLMDWGVASVLGPAWSFLCSSGLSSSPHPTLALR